MDYNSTGAMRSPFSPRIRQSIAGRRPIGLNSGNINQSKFMQSHDEQGGDVIYKTPTLTVETYGAPLPVMVTEALTFASNDVSVKLSPSGWCWVVWGRRVLAWSRGAEPAAPVAVSSPAARELTLPQTDLAHKADLVEIFYDEGAQMASCIGVSPEGVVRYWPSVAQEGVYTDVSCELAGQECDRLVAPDRPGSLVLATTTCTLVVITPTVLDGRATVQCKTLRPPSGWLGGIGRRVSLLFFGSMPAHADTKLVGVVCIGSGYSETPEAGVGAGVGAGAGAGCVALVAGHSGGPVLQLWTPHHTHEHALRRHLTETSHHHYHGDPNSLEIIALDVRAAPSGSGLLLLLAIVNVARSPEIRYAIAHISLEHLDRPVVTSLTGLRGAAAEPEPAPAPRFLPLHSHVVLYTPAYIALVPTTASNESAEYVDVGGAEDRVVCGAASGGAALVFSLRHGVLRLRAGGAGEAGAASPSAPHETGTGAAGAGLALFELDPRALAALATDAPTRLATAFLFHVRGDTGACRSLLRALWPAPDAAGDVDAGVDRAVLAAVAGLLDDAPAGDPRWRAPPHTPHTRHTHVALGSSSQLQVLAQLQDKKRAFTLFLDFLRATGLWQRMQSVTFEGSVCRTSSALGALAERLAAALALRELQHQRQEPLIEDAIYAVVAGGEAADDAALAAGGALGAGDVCYRRVTGVLRVLAALADAPLPTPDLALRALEILNHVVSAMQACRAQWGGAAGGAVGGARSAPALAALQRRAVRSLARDCADAGLRARLLDAAAAGAALLLQEVPPDLRDQYAREAILHFLEEGYTERAVRLAEQFRDYELLVDICGRGGDVDRLLHYVDKYSDDGVPERAFSLALDARRGGGLAARLCAARGAAGARLVGWLRARSGRAPAAALLAARHLAQRDHEAAAAALLAVSDLETDSLNRAQTAASLAKLCLWSAEGGGAAGGAARGVEARLALLEHHAALPLDVRRHHALPDHDSRVYSPEELIQLYVCGCGALSAYDYKTALDLTEHVADAERRDDLRLQVWCASVARDDWAPAPGECARAASPGADLQDKTFFRLIDLVHVMGGDVSLLLPPVEDILTAPALAELLSDPRAQYQLRYGYECLDTARDHAHGTSRG